MTLLTILWAFLKAHWTDILVVVAFVGVLFLLWKHGKKKKVVHILHDLVAKAEDKWGPKTGGIKWATVYAALPWIVRVFFTQAEICAMIDDAVAWLKKKLDEKEAALADQEAKSA